MQPRWAQRCPEHRPECSHGKPDIKRSQVSPALEPQTFPTVPQEICGILGMDFRAIHGREKDCKTPICMSDKCLKWCSRDYLGFRGFTTALSTLPDFCLLFLICSSHCWMFAFLLARASFQTHGGLFLIFLLMAVIRLHLKNFLQCQEMCTDKIPGVRRPKRRRIPRKGSPAAVLRCGHQPLVWSLKNVTGARSWQAASKENILHSAQVAEKRLQY